MLTGTFTHPGSQEASIEARRRADDFSAFVDCAIADALPIRLEACELERDLLPPGTISLETAISRRVNCRDRRVLCLEGEAAWDAILDGIVAGSVHPLALTPSGETFESASDQFHGHRFCYLRICTKHYDPVLVRSEPGLLEYQFPRIEGPKHYPIKDSRGVTHLGNLIFLEREIEVAPAQKEPAYGGPLTTSVPLATHTPKKRKTCLPLSRDPDVIKFMKEGKFKSCGEAIEAAKNHFQAAISRARGRELWDKTGLSRSPGRPSKFITAS
jgi:hypothetical protein